MADVQMPRLSDSMETGKIVKWLKREGEEVKRGEPLVEIESDKANIEVEAYSAGKLSQIVVPEGESAPIGAVIARIGGDGEGSGAQAGSQPPEAAAPRAKPREEQPRADQPQQSSPRRQEPAQQGGGEQYPQGGPDDREEAGPAAQAALRSVRRAQAGEGDGERIKASPVARRLAEERGIQLEGIQGSGPGGRITREDVEAALSKGTGGLKTRPAPTPSEAEAPARAPAVARPTEEAEVVELSKMQATVAMRMAQSKFSAPHFYVTSEVAMDDAVRLRQMFNESVPREQAISVNDLLIRAVALALTRFPQVNASWADGRVKRKRDINIGIAVNLEDGLIVPVLRNADRKSLHEIGMDARALIERARTKKARAEDYQGNTFTISNLGMYDVDQFTAIINPPDSAILAVGAIVDKPVIREGQVAVGKRMRVTLSVDHRVFYGVTAAQFLQEVKRLLEHPMALVL